MDISTEISTVLKKFQVLNLNREQTSISTLYDNTCFYVTILFIPFARIIWWSYDSQIEIIMQWNKPITINSRGCSHECFSQNMHNNLVCMLGEDVQGFKVGPYNLIHADVAGNFVFLTIISQLPFYLSFIFLSFFQAVDNVWLVKRWIRH